MLGQVLLHRRSLKGLKSITVLLQKFQAAAMPAQPLRAAEAAASSLLAAVESHSPHAVNQIRQHLVPALAHFSVRPVTAVLGMCL